MWLTLIIIGRHIATITRMLECYNANFSIVIENPRNATLHNATAILKFENAIMLLCYCYFEI